MGTRIWGSDYRRRLVDVIASDHMLKPSQRRGWATVALLATRAHQIHVRITHM